MSDIDKIAYDIRGCAFKVWNEYKWGFSEAVYEAAMELLLADLGYRVGRQQELQCYFQGRRIKQTYRMDLVINDVFILELKAVHDVVPEHRAQVLNYSNLFQKPNCMLLNFGPDGVHSERYFVHFDTHEVELLR